MFEPLKNEIIEHGIITGIYLMNKTQSTSELEGSSNVIVPLEVTMTIRNFLSIQSEATRTSVEVESKKHLEEKCRFGS